MSCVSCVLVAKAAWPRSVPRFVSAQKHGQTQGCACGQGQAFASQSEASDATTNSIQCDLALHIGLHGCMNKYYVYTSHTRRCACRISQVGIDSVIDSTKSFLRHGKRATWRYAGTRRGKWPWPASPPKKNTAKITRDLCAWLG